MFRRTMMCFVLFFFVPANLFAQSSLLVADQSGNSWSIDSTFDQRFRFIGNSGAVYDGMAVFNGVIYATGNATQFYQIHPDTGKVLVIGNHEYDGPFPILNGRSAGLAIVGGIPYIAAQGPFGTGDLYSSNLSTANDTRIGSMGEYPAGGMAVDRLGRVVVTICDPIGFGTFHGCGDRPTSLAWLNLTTGAANVIGPNGVSGIKALTNWNDQLFGFAANQIYEIDISTGAATLLGSTVPPIMVSAATSTSLVVSPSEVRRDTLVSELTTAPNMFFVLNGWNGVFNDSPQPWMSDMVQSILRRVDNAVWQGQSLNSFEISGGTIDQLHAIDNAGISQGWSDGGFIGSRMPNTVVLMAHSAGLSRANAMSDMIKVISPDTKVYIYGMDGLNLFHPQLAINGASADSYINLFVRDLPTGAITEQLSPYHDVDMTEIAGFIPLHSDPRTAVQISIDDAEDPIPDLAGYGWPSTPMARGLDYNPAAEFPPNVEVSILPNRGDFESDPQHRVVERDSPTPDLEASSVEVFGEVVATPDSVQLSANFGEPAVNTMEMNLDNPWNLLQVDVEFGDNVAGALFRASVNESSWSFDGRYAPLGATRLSFPLDEDMTTSSIVTFRLDGFDDPFSSVTVSGVTFTQVEVVNWVPGDFDGNQVRSSGDIDLLQLALKRGTLDNGFDMNGDGFVTVEDIQHWVGVLADTWIGDANIDGEFNSGDLVQVFQAGTYDNGMPSVWSKGDWNTDGLFDSSDLVLAFQDGGYEIGPKARLAKVPEPSSLFLFLFGAAMMLRRRK